jgi:hypothetical protein
MLPSTRTRAAAVAVVTLLGSLLLAVAPVGSAGAASNTEVVTGVLKFPQKDHPKVQLLWFDKSWNYLGKKAAGGGSYALNLVPGTYHLQFVDQRPSYKIEKYAPTDVQVTVRAGDPTIRNVKMKPGGYVTGTIRTGDGKPAKNARVVAANRAEQSFETTANAKGQFAVGGLPQGKYSMFTWDKKKRWVGKSSYAGLIKPRKGRDVAIRLNKRAGALRVLLYTSNGSLGGKTSVTITSKATGQWWTATAKGGTAIFEGLYPGGYKLKFDGVGVWLPQTGTVVSGKVKSNQTDLGKFKVTKRGASVSGSVVDAKDTTFPLEGAQVLLFNGAGTKLGTTTSDSSGRFSFTGQLTTQSGMTVVAQTGLYSPYLGKGTHYCKYGTATTAPFAITTSRDSAIGLVALPHLPADEQDDPATCGP